MGQNVMPLLEPTRPSLAVVLLDRQEVGFDLCNLFEQRLPALLDGRRGEVHLPGKFDVRAVRQSLCEEGPLALAKPKDRLSILKEIGGN